MERNRREALKAALAGGAVLLGAPRVVGNQEAPAAGACTLAASQEEGPFVKVHTGGHVVHTGQHGAGSVLRISGSVAAGLRGAITVAVDA